MSWLDGMVEENEAASQDQRLARTSERLAPGFFTGAYDAFGQGLVRGGIEAVNSVKSLAVQAAGADQAMSLGLSSMVLDGQGAAEQIEQVNTDTARRADVIGKDTALAVSLLRPDPADVGFAGQILSEAAAILPRTIAGAVAAGPLGAAVAAGAPTGYASKQVGVAEGLDETTATQKGLIDAATMGVGAVFPAARFVKPLLGDAAIAVGANVGLGMAGRGATAALLDNGGYHSQAAQYRAMDGTAIITDAVLGGAFFGIGRMTGRAKPTREQVDAAMTERQAQHADIDTAPGAPINPKSAVAHQQAIRTAIDQLSRGEPVVLPESIHSAEFLRSADDVTPIAPSRAEVLERAAADITPGIKKQLRKEIAADLPNTKDLTSELAAVKKQIDDLSEVKGPRQFATAGDEIGGRAKANEEIQQLTQRRAELEKQLERSDTAESARGDMESLGRGEIPERFQSKLESQADKISKGFQKTPIAAGISEASAKPTTAQIARQEIGRILDDIERADPTLQPKPLDIGEPRALPKPASDATNTGKNATQPAESATSAPDNATSAPKDSSQLGAAAADPEVQVANEILARMDDMRLSTGAMDADGNPVTVSARELLAEADADIAQAQQDSQGFAAAAACFLQRGVD